MYEIDNFWLNKLEDVLKQVPLLLRDDNWETLVINKRKPHTYRAWKFLENEIRVCLHRFEPCSEDEAFMHPHPWPGAFIVLLGKYVMKMGLSRDRGSEPEHVSTLSLASNSAYAITNPLAWHSVQPLERCWSIMINGKPFYEPHERAPTTKGKDLEKMTEDQLRNHLSVFFSLSSLKGLKND